MYDTKHRKSSDQLIPYAVRLPSVLLGRLKDAAIKLDATEVSIVRAALDRELKKIEKV